MKKLVIVFSTLALALGIPMTTYAKVGSNDLIEQGKKYDQSMVVYEGEAIREAMIRGNHGWINVSDGNNAIGIWTKKEDLLRIKHYGSYQSTGDVIRVTGIFHRSCPEHGGDMDIHAKSLQVVKTGTESIHNIRKDSWFWLVLSLVLAGVTYCWKWVGHKV
jgi:hypothetical protein